MSTPEKVRLAIQNWISQGDPQWAGKTPQQVAEALGYTSQTGGGTAPGASSGVMQQMIEWETALRANNGDVPPNRDQWVQRFAMIAGVTPEQAGAMWDRRQQWLQLTGGTQTPRAGLADWYPPEGEFDAWLGQIAPQPTLAREAMELQNQQAWANLLASKSGPRDYWTYKMMQANMPQNVRFGDMRALANATPAFGAMTPGNNSWEMTFANWLQNQQGGAGTTQPGPTAGNEQASSFVPGPGATPAANAYPAKDFVTPTLRRGGDGGQANPQSPYMATRRVAPSTNRPLTDEDYGHTTSAGPPLPVKRDDWRGVFRQPNEFSPRTWNRLGPSGQQMQLGQWSAYSLDPNEAFAMMKRSWQGGSANPRTRWSW